VKAAIPRKDLILPIRFPISDGNKNASPRLQRGWPVLPSERNRCDLQLSEQQVHPFIGPCAMTH
jgi:hypothetical protein